MTRSRGQQRPVLNDKPQWALFSDLNGLRATPEPVTRLPHGAIVSADGRFAEIQSKDGRTVRVFVKLGGVRLGGRA